MPRQIEQEAKMIYTSRYTIEGPGLDNFNFPAGEALIAVGDSHGQADALRGLLDGMGRFVTPGKTRHLVFLGDFIDRGPDSLGCLTAAAHEAQDRVGADKVTFLPGNHELLMADALEAAAYGGNLGYRSPAECWSMNGGMHFMIEVFEHLGVDMPKEPVDVLKRFAAAIDHLAPDGMTIAEWIRTWPSHQRVGDVLCVHAGLAPKKPHEHTLSLTQKEHFPASMRDRDISDRHWAWIRDRFLAWQGGWPDCGTKGLDGCLVLHGHTVPASARASKLEHGEGVREVFCRMTTNARVCLDGGAARDVGVAGAIITDEGMRVAFNPC
jgi:serine/threonine protein phosphatase 1